MRRTSILSLLFVPILALTVSADGFAAAGEWISLFDGKSLSGWRVNEHPDSFRVEEGMIVCQGERAHLFYTGEDGNAEFKNFELQAEVMTTPGANSGVYIHTAFQESGWPEQGYEIQVNHSHIGEGGYHERKKTGSLYGVRNQFKSLVPDQQWFTLRILVQGKRIVTQVNDTVLVDYVEPEEPVRGKDYQGRRLSSGTFALQCHDPESRVYYRNLRVKPLPDTPETTEAAPAEDAVEAQIISLSENNFPLIDYHVHLKGTLTLEDALRKSRETGIYYGIAPNCGIGFPITDDQGIYDFVEKMKGQPVFLGMQAEGREWVQTFSPEARAQFDYVFSDALTFTDDQGRRCRIWIPEEVWVEDKQEFMDMYVDRIVAVMSEPIDIFVNPTFLPDVIAAEYDALWTEERMQKVIDAAVEHGVAIEINDRYRIPSARFIRLAKAAGVRFTFGTNNGDENFGRLEYCLEMMDACGLTGEDLFLPKSVR